MAKDFITDDTGDLIIKDGDFVVDHSDQQHVEDLLVANPGEYKQHPWLGIAIQNFIKGSKDARTREQIEKRVKLQLKSDGAENIKVKLMDFDNIKIDAEYHEEN